MPISHLNKSMLKSIYSGSTLIKLFSSNPIVMEHVFPVFDLRRVPPTTTNTIGGYWDL